MAAPLIFGAHTRASVDTLCIGSSASASTPAACHTPDGMGVRASSRRISATSAVSHRSIRVQASVARS